MGAAAKESLPLLLAVMGSSVLGGLTAPEGQELESFSGDAEIDPRQMLRDARGGVLNVSEHAASQLNDPLLLETRVPSLPAFTGGGLPFAIGAPAQDQAYVNPAVAVSPGRAMRRPLPGGHETREAEPSSPPGRPGPPDRPPSSGQPGDDPKRLDDLDPRSSTAQRRPLWADETQAGNEGDDDVSRAMGAAEILMQLAKPRSGMGAPA